MICVQNKYRSHPHYVCMDPALIIHLQGETWQRRSKNRKCDGSIWMLGDDGPNHHQTPTHLKQPFSIQLQMKLEISKLIHQPTGELPMEKLAHKLRICNCESMCILQLHNCDQMASCIIHEIIIINNRLTVYNFTSSAAAWRRGGWQRANRQRSTQSKSRKTRATVSDASTHHSPHGE